MSKRVKKSKKKQKKRSFLQKIYRFLLKCLFVFVTTTFIWVLFYKFVPVPYTPLMGIRALEQKNNEKNIVFQHDWVDLEYISPALQKAVIASEDAHFLTHYGFDFKAMQAAFTSNLKGKKIRGGSTISQQTAKNVFLWNKRSYVRKILEAYFTCLIELLWSKERIMEVYLNSIEFGEGIYGAEAAAMYWYNKEARSLSYYEAAGLAVILPNPRKFKPIHSSSYIQQRKNKIKRYAMQVALKYK